MSKGKKNENKSHNKATKNNTDKCKTSDTESSKIQNTTEDITE